MATKSVTENDLYKARKIREYVRAHDMTHLGTWRERYSNEIYAAVVNSHKHLDGKFSYTFGRVYHVFAERCTYEQCGCAYYDTEKQARLAAFAFFGIK